jgi:hypothetical protein
MNDYQIYQEGEKEAEKKAAEINRNKALHIVNVSDSDLTIRETFKEIIFIKYNDTDVGLEIIDKDEHVEYIFTKKQIDFIAKWIIK